MKKEQFRPSGALALDPRAFGGFFSEAVKPEEQPASEVAQVLVRGPLMHHRGFWFCSYEEIRAEVRCAMERGAKSVLLRIDSPGGLVSGAYDTARDLRAMSSEFGVPLLAFIEGQGTSAAYALASAAERIYSSASAEVGSIGVIDTLVDVTANDEEHGINIQLITSGARKSDGNPHSKITDEARSAVQDRVNELATQFFELVEDHRGISSATVQSMQAAVFSGREALDMGLVDEVVSLAQMTEFAASYESERENEMSLKNAIASLEAAAKGEDEEEAKRAKAALAAMSAMDDEDETSEDDEDETSEDDEDKTSKKKGKKSEDDEDETSEDDEDETSEDDEDETAKAMAVKALAKVHRLEVRDKKRREKDEREKLLASRPDFSKSLLKVLKTAPMSVVREMVEELERGDIKNPKAAAAQSGVKPTVGDKEGKERGNRSDPATCRALDEAFGLTGAKSGVVNTDYKITLGAMVDNKEL